MLSMALLNFFLTPINALAPAYVEDVLRKGPEAIGYFTMAFVIGNIVGGFFVGKVAARLSLERMLTFGLVLTGVFYALMALPGVLTSFPSIGIACSAAAFVGFFVTFASAGLSTFFMTYVPKDMMARFSSVVGMFALSAMPLGSMVSGVLSSLFGMMVLILGFGILFALTAFLPFIALRQIKNAKNQELQKDPSIHKEGVVNHGREIDFENARRDPNYDGSLSD
ncbi:MAG: MFS transporter, partial [Vallitaleaceae bacterium]|nr:MFS transporter [Vallitaleaceae bacterium]